MHLVEIEVYATNLSYYELNPICTFQDFTVIHYTNQTELEFTTDQFSLGDGCEIAFHLYVNLKNTTLTCTRYEQYFVKQLENETVVFIEDKGEKKFARTSNELFTFERIEAQKRQHKGEDYEGNVDVLLDENFQRFMREVDQNPDIIHQKNLQF